MKNEFRKSTKIDTNFTLAVPPLDNGGGCVVVLRKSLVSTDNAVELYIRKMYISPTLSILQFSAYGESRYHRVRTGRCRIR